MYICYWYKGQKDTDNEPSLHSRKLTCDTCGNLFPVWKTTAFVYRTLVLIQSLINLILYCTICAVCTQVDFIALGLCCSGQSCSRIDFPLTLFHSMKTTCWIRPWVRRGSCAQNILELWNSPFLSMIRYRRRGFGYENNQTKMHNLYYWNIFLLNGEIRTTLVKISLLIGGKDVVVKYVVWLYIRNLMWRKNYICDEMNAQVMLLKPFS